MAKDKESKQILSNVVFHDRAYGPGDEDHLEERLTAERYEQLKAADPPVLAGDWKPKGKGDKPMGRSRAATDVRHAALVRGPGPHPAAPDKPHPAEGENERLRAENHKLRAEVESHAKAAESAAHAAKHAKHAEK